MTPLVKQDRSMLTFGIIIVLAVVAAVVIILISSNKPVSTGGTVTLAEIPDSRQADGGFVKGESTAPITIVEFADYACSHCQEYKPTIDQFIKDFVSTGKAKFEYRVFPTAGGQITGFFGTLAACMDEQKQGAFWDAGELFTQKAEQGNYGEKTAQEVASAIGVDYNKALACAQNNTQVQTDVALGESLGVNGTPAVAVRYKDGTLQWITYQGQTYNRGGAPYNVLAAIVNSVQ